MKLSIPFVHPFVSKRKWNMLHDTAFTTKPCRAGLLNAKICWNSGILCTGIQIANGRSCEATPSWIKYWSFTECEIVYHCTNYYICHLCCTTPQNRIDKTLVPWMSQISIFIFLPIHIASAHQRIMHISFTK